MHWASGVIDGAAFEARALYALYVALLGVATDAIRPQIEDELRALERRLAIPSQSTRPRSPICSKKSKSA